MAILSTTHIHINGNELTYYNSCRLKQEIGEHHHLDLFCLLETIQKFCDNNKQEIDALLGATLTIETKSYTGKSFYGLLKFKGIITGLNFRKGLFSSEGDLVEIKVQSPTIIADNGAHHTSFDDKSFKEIMDENFNDYDTSRLEVNTKNSKLTTPIAYTVQNNESCFNFAQRLAARNGEWMYYNGERLVFGLDPKSDELELILGRDLHNLNTSLLPTPQNFMYQTNDYLTDDVHEKKSTTSAKSKEGYLNILNDTSKELYANPTKKWFNLSDDANSKSRLDTYVDLQQNAMQANQIKISGTSDNPGVTLGVTIKISGSTYIVTHVEHTYASNGEYENYFEANTSSIKIYPKTDINAFPITHSQTAKVIENNDPDGLGRVKVQFAWQRQDGLTTPWIRIMTPHAGGDKGFHFIPEIDEEVLVDFEGSNAEAPFVMGALYHGSHKPDSWKSDKNDIKAIRTRSGHTVELNDADGKESITISDAGGNIIHFNTATKNITISAPETMEFNAKNMKFNVEEDMEMTIGKNKTETITETHEVSMKNDKKSVMENSQINVGKKTEHVSGEITLHSSTGKMLLDGTGKITIQSKDTINYGD